MTPFDFNIDCKGNLRVRRLYTDKPDDVWTYWIEKRTDYKEFYTECMTNELAVHKEWKARQEALEEAMAVLRICEELDTL